MIYLLDGEIKMWLFRGKAKKAQEKRLEKELQSIRTETHEYAVKATESTEKLIKLLDEDELGVAGLIFYATPGGGKEIDKSKRKKHGK